MKYFVLLLSLISSQLYTMDKEQKDSHCDISMAVIRAYLNGNFKYQSAHSSMKIDTALTGRGEVIRTIIHADNDTLKKPHNDASDPSNELQHKILSTIYQKQYPNFFPRKDQEEDLACDIIKNGESIDGCRTTCVYRSDEHDPKKGYIACDTSVEGYRSLIEDLSDWDRLK